MIKISGSVKKQLGSGLRFMAGSGYGLNEYGAVTLAQLHASQVKGTCFCLYFVNVCCAILRQNFKKLIVKKTDLRKSNMRLGALVIVLN